MVNRLYSVYFKRKKRLGRAADGICIWKAEFARPRIFALLCEFASDKFYSLTFCTCGLFSTT